MEWMMIASMTAGGFLSAWGGTYWKPARRFILPIVLALIVYIAKRIQRKKDWWRCILLAAGLMIAFCLPYGDRTAYWLKFLVFCSYSIATLALGFSWWQAMVPPIIFLEFVLSNYPPTAAIFPWKIVEFSYGAGVGIIVAHLMTKDSSRAP